VKLGLQKNTKYNLEIQGYESYHLFGNKAYNTRKGRASGGLSIYYKSELKTDISVVETIKSGIVCIRIDKKLFDSDNHVFICAIYIPPKNSRISNPNDHELFDILEHCIEKYKTKGC